MESLDVHVALVKCLNGSSPPIKAVAFGRGESGELIMDRSVIVAGFGYPSRSEDSKELMLSSLEISKAWEGGPLFDFDGNFLGMNIFSVMEKINVLSWGTILNQLEHYLPSLQNRIVERAGKMDIFELPNFNPDAPRQRYRNDYLTKMNYPKPPVNMLYDGMILANSFEETFGHLYDQGGRRHFACTGFFIDWTEGYRTIILTSASLVRESDDGCKIAENLEIRVLLPNGNYDVGFLQHCSLHYNVALVSTRHRCNAPPVCIQPNQFNCSWVAAIGYFFESGKLMFESGRLVDWTGTLDCHFLLRSCCRITKAGIGGPLVDLDGKVLGMNFYDKKIGTPYLPWDVISRILGHFKNGRSSAEVDYGRYPYYPREATPMLGRSLNPLSCLSGWNIPRDDNANLHRVCDKTACTSSEYWFMLPQSPTVAPDWTIGRDNSVTLNRWPVPLPYWRQPDDMEKEEPPRGCEDIYTYVEGVRLFYL